jgi:threonine/homoserine/homoserine lactone efflux protein
MLPFTCASLPGGAARCLRGARVRPQQFPGKALPEQALAAIVLAAPPRYEAASRRDGGRAPVMLTAEYFIKGLIVGFLIAAPVGPVAVMCIHRTIAHGRLAGYVCGLGATLADTIFGAIAALGLGFIANEVISHHYWLRVIGGAVLVGLGLRMMFARHLPTRAEKQEAEEERGQRLAPKETGSRLDFHIGNFIAAFAIMITNPITLFSFAAIFTFLDISDIGASPRWGASLVAGVAVGAGAWWTLLVMVSALCRHRLDETGILWVNRVSGALILAFGLALLLFPSSFANHM